LQLDELEKKFLSARDVLQKEAAERIAYSRSTYKQEVGKELEQESHNVRNENKNLHIHLKIHEMTSDRLQKRYGEVKGRIVSLKRDVELNVQKEKEYKMKDEKRDNIINELSKETNALEEELMKQIQAYNTQRTHLSLQHTQQLTPLTSSLQNKRLHAEKVDKENKKLRKMAKKILRSKKEMEIFFLSALQQVRESIKLKKQLHNQETALLQAAKLRELTLTQGKRSGMSFTQGKKGRGWDEGLFHVCSYYG